MMNVAYNMDCMVAMKEFPDKFFDLAVVDPVYGDVTGGGYTTNKFDGVSHQVGTGAAKQRAYHRAVWNQPKTGSDYFKELFRVSHNQVIWGANFFVEHLPSSQGWIVWDKKKPAGITFSDCELAFTSFNTALRIFRFRWNGMLQEDMKSKEAKIHPTQKPVALYEWILKKYAKPGMKIIDTHLGSGSSRIAAYNQGIDFWGYEIDETYFNLQEERFAKHTAQMNLFVDEEYENEKMDWI